MFKKTASNTLLLVASLLFSMSLHASLKTTVEESSETIIPLMTDAKVFARFDQELPAVINYFTEESESAIIAFYQNHYGEPETQERKRGRLTLSYLQENSNIRIIISEQDNHRQVDIIKM